MLHPQYLKEYLALKGLVVQKKCLLGGCVWVTIASEHCVTLRSTIARNHCLFRDGPAGFLLTCLYGHCQHGSYIDFGMALADESSRVSMVLPMQGPRRHGKAMVLFEGLDPMCSAHSLYDGYMKPLEVFMLSRLFRLLFWQLPSSAFASGIGFQIG